MQVLDARHPGLREKVHRMFEELSRSEDVRHMVEGQYGERLSLATIARYKRRHWQAPRALLQEMRQPMGSPDHRALEELSVVRGQSSVVGDTERRRALSH
jgi:hypothetical protein